MTWTMKIHNKMKKQLNMCELSVHNGKVILIDSDKCYDKKMGKMLKTNDNKYVSKKVINNKKNKLYWRHLYSYLPWETIELINQMIYKYKMKSEILGIENVVYFHKNYNMENLIKEVYDLSLQNISFSNNYIEYERRMKEVKKEEWIEVDINKEDIFECVDFEKKIKFWKNRHIRFNERIRDTNTKSKKLQKYIKSLSIKHFSMDQYCCGIMGNGDLCGCESSEKIMIDRDYFNDQINPITFSDNCWYYYNNSDVRYMTNKDKERKKIELSLCKRHYNKYDKMNKKQLDNEVEKIYNKMGYGLRNGYMCKTC
tara:strand:- start:72 stop:1007 length:936 start_codon:yes stop_codon:yes gene_type:complete